MAFLTREELSTHLFDEVVAEIARDDNGKPDEAIKAAIEDVGCFLSNYDRTAIFAATGDNRNPIILLYSKDVAVWHFIQLASPNVDIAMRETRYNLAIAALTLIQKGTRVPNLPRLPAPEVPEQNGQVRYGDRRPKMRGHL